MQGKGRKAGGAEQRGHAAPSTTREFPGTRIQEQEKGTVVPQHNLVSFNAIYNNIKE